MKQHDVIDEHVTITPDVMLGKPIIRGTRVPVYLIVDFIASGQTPDEIVADYPDLTIEDVEAALAYARGEAERTETQAQYVCRGRLFFWTRIFRCGSHVSSMGESASTLFHSRVDVSASCLIVRSSPWPGNPAGS